MFINKPIIFTYVLLLIGLSACQNNELYDNDVIGLWIAEDTNVDEPSQLVSTQLKIHSDFTFEGAHFNPRLILTGPESRGTILDKTTGTWSLTKEGLATGVYLNTKFPEHSLALIAMPVRQNGNIYLKIKNNNQILLFKKVSQDATDSPVK